MTTYIDTTDPEPDWIDLPPRTYIEVRLPSNAPLGNHDTPCREGLWIRVYDDSGEYQGDIDWPHTGPGSIQ